MASIPERLREALMIRGMKQAELVSKTGIGKSSISTYLSGEYEPKQRNIYKIAIALNVSEAWLMGFDVPMKREDVKPERAIPSGFHPIPTTNKKPRLGVISCGNPIDTPENFDGYDDVPDMFDCDFTLVCEGDSMMGARICDGDIVYIKQQPTIENGQIAAVLIDGEEKLLKRVYITDESIILQAENPAYPPRSYHREDMNRVSIIGKVVGFTSMVK